MKKILVFIGFVLTLAVSSCSNDDELDLRFEPLRVTDVNFPEEVHVLEAYQVDVTYLRPSSCHYFEGFDYENTGENETTVFLIASVFNDQPCQELNVELETSFEFKPEEAGNYTFRFWQGKNADDEDIYYSVDVLVK